MDHVRRRTRSEAIEQPGQRPGDHRRSTDRQQEAPSALEQRDDEPAADHNDDEDAGADDDDVDDPIRDRTEPAQQIGGEARERVAEQPLHTQEHEQHRDCDRESQHIGRRTDRLGRSRLDDDGLDRALTHVSPVPHTLLECFDQTLKRISSTSPSATS